MFGYNLFWYTKAKKMYASDDVRSFVILQIRITYWNTGLFFRRLSESICYIFCNQSLWIILFQFTEISIQEILNIV